MCFIVDKKICPDKKVASKDIVCYKIVFDDSHWWKFWNRNKHVRSVVQGYKYTIGASNPTIKLIKYNEYQRFKYIANGYHSFKSNVSERFENEAACMFALTERKPIGVTCIIPKGSEYYENEDEYVSSDIIIKDKFEIKISD